MVAISTFWATMVTYMENYDHSKIEGKWQEYWKKNNIYHTDITSDKPKKYILDMFPYPSGSGLHVGHPRGYIATDVYSRYSRMCGFNVLHPMGFDAFGLPAENHAIKNQVHPSVQMNKNIQRYKDQLSILGIDYDWRYEVNTTDPDFYRWTQWQFLQMYKNGLVYESNEPINWCPSCQTGLANEDLEIDGTCEICGSETEKKPIRQWVIEITKYADRLIEDLNTISDWPNWVKEAQKNWIGKSSGAEIYFTLQVAGADVEQVKVFTTRPDTLMGVTYIVLAPEHSLVKKLGPVIHNNFEVSDYVKASAKKSVIDRQAYKEKTGTVLSGVGAVHPITGEVLPVWISDYVLANYGFGAVMAVPAHDERDYEFAQKFQLSIKTVVIGEGDPVYTGNGKLTNSGEFDGFESNLAKGAITEKAGGRMVNTYRLNDWVFSRQRYWGEPIPLVHTEDGVTYPVNASDLPVVLPDVKNYQPSGTGESPLATITDWVNVTGYINEEGEFVQAVNAPEGTELIKVKRETNTMPQWAGSSWYYLRYLDNKNQKEMIADDIQKKWLPVDVYVGGDHATRHLIYARFWHKFLYDVGIVDSIEPFLRLEYLGYILAEDGSKISKRKNNGEAPDDMVNRFGADSLRTYEMFIGPFEKSVPWNTDGLVGTRRFIEKVYRQIGKVSDGESTGGDVQVLLHKTIKKVESDIESFKFNTAVSAMMILINEIDKSSQIAKSDFENFLKILAPFAPHVTEEIWHKLGNDSSIHLADWPIYDKSLIADDVVVIAIQVNGKVRASIELSVDIDKDSAIRQAKENKIIQKYLTDTEIIKEIYVPGRIISFVTRD